MKVDKDGRSVVVGNIVRSCATEHKDKFNQQKAKVERLNSNAAVVTMLEGPAQKEKRKVEYKLLEVWTPSKQTKTYLLPLAHPARLGLRGQKRRALRRLTPSAESCLAT